MSNGGGSSAATVLQRSGSIDAPALERLDRRSTLQHRPSMGRRSHQGPALQQGAQVTLHLVAVG